MATFVDKFDRANQNTLGDPLVYGWLRMHNAGTYGVGITDKVATNEASTQAVAAQAKTYQATEHSEARAEVVFTAVGATNSITIGANGFTPDGLADGSTWSWGFGAKLIFSDAATRTLQIIRQSNTGAFGFTAGAQEVMATVTVPLLTKKNTAGTSDLGIIQDLRVIVTAEKTGTRIRAYLNETDDDQPTLEWIDKRDKVLLTNAAAQGYWYFAFGSTTALQLVVHFFEAFDYAYRRYTLIRRDTLTRAEIIAQAKQRYEGSNAQSTFDAPLAIEYANNAQDEILNEIGDLASFLQARESIGINVDSQGYFTLPSYVESPLQIVSDSWSTPASFKLLGYTSEGQLQCLMLDGDSGPYWVLFEVKRERMERDDHVSVIPRRFSECLILGVAYRMAAFDTQSPSYETLKVEFREKLFQMKSKLNKMRRATQPRLHTPRPYWVEDVPQDFG